LFGDASGAANTTAIAIPASAICAAQFRTRFLPMLVALP
jgi:hypothetical protein